ncbi:peptidyl-prolyl cis-trans isomerase [Thalassobaculum sp. OXR-137]|uniref:peptidyl-prolyl cis-trans isomerase n=1 Tax=Thalassobaculum sp. OXR-137 TaxID=3100173 RepID=UPI002AC99210|nr:peptidyl-prolyl cis-trans isomerase [Thalassobaculum sp. OXR-137]WPZ33256.1 peptidyl-prolyl cis-trans isomerase [Thalassobaculum sp. OXR-137]
MLQFIRSKVSSIFVKILFVLLIASFAIWGIGDTIFGSPAGRAAVEVDGDVRVTAVEAAEEFDRSRRRLGIPLTVDQAIQLGLLDQTLQNLTVQSLMVVATNRLGLSASDEQIVQLIHRQFRDSLGQFDRTAYQTFLASNGWSESEFVSRARRDLARNQLIGAVAAGSEKTVPDAIVKTLHDYREERRIAAAVRIDASALPAPEQPDEAALSAYYEERKKDYETPEYRGVSWLAVSPQSIAQSMEIPEDELRELFEERKASFDTRGTRTVDQALFADQDAAGAAYDRIQAGEDFAAVAEEVTGMSAAELDFGQVTRSDLPEGTAEAVFALTEPGSVTEPVESPFGWHLFRIREAEVGAPASFEDVRDDLRREVALERAYDEVFERSNAVEDALAAGSTLEEAARSLNIPLNQIPFVARDGSQPAGGIVTTLPGEPFLRTAFETETGTQSTLTETRDGTYFILRVDGVEPPRIPELGQVRPAVLADWDTEQRLERAEDIADEIVAAVKAGTPLAEAAAEHDLTVERLPAITRQGQGLTPGWPPAVAGALFEQKAGGASAVSSDQGAAVVTLVEVIEGGGSMAGPQDQVRAEIAGAVSNDLIELLLADLESRHEVTVNPGAVRQLFTVNEGAQ